MLACSSRRGTLMENCQFGDGTNAAFGAKHNQRVNNIRTEYERTASSFRRHRLPEFLRSSGLLCCQSDDVQLTTGAARAPGRSASIQGDIQSSKFPVLSFTLQAHLSLPRSIAVRRILCDIIPRSHSYCLSLSLCLEWYNRSITPRVHSGVTKPAQC